MSDMIAKSRRRQSDRWDRTLGQLAESRASLQEVIADFGPGIRRAFDQGATQFGAATKRMDEGQARTDERFRETDAQLRETDAEIREMARENARRSREMDERVDKLVLGIGELIRTQNPPRA